MLGTSLRFRSGGKEIRVERFESPWPGGARGAVVLLHGADGLASGRYRVAAGLVAAAGHDVFLVHYLDRTGDVWAGFSTIGQRFPLWAATVRESVDFVAEQPGVAAERLAILGISLGAALGLEVAAGDPRVEALVAYYGFVPRGLSRAGRLPPTLVLHGARDAVVPVANAHQFQAILERQGVPHEIKIYPDQGHGFSMLAEMDAGQRTAAFLARHLGRGAAAAATPAGAPS